MKSQNIFFFSFLLKHLEPLQSNSFLVNQPQSSKRWLLKVNHYYREETNHSFSVTNFASMQQGVEMEVWSHDMVEHQMSQLVTDGHGKNNKITLRTVAYNERTSTQTLHQLQAETTHHSSQSCKNTEPTQFWIPSASEQLLLLLLLSSAQNLSSEHLWIGTWTAHCHIAANTALATAWVLSCSCWPFVSI